LVCFPVTIPEGFVKQGEYTGDYLGIVRRKTAKQLVDMFGDKAEEIRKHLKTNQMGTKVQFYEWWTDEKVFWTLGDVVLDKRKNPHWNEDDEEIVVDDFGNESTVVTEGLNHWTRPRMPFSFLTVFSLQKRPHDETSLILQNLANQDIVNKRIRQIDRNVDEMNNGWKFDGNSFDQKQAARAIDQLRKGNGIVIPDGNMNGVEKVTGQSLPADVYNNLNDIRNELEGIFGTLGVSPQGLAGEETARGKILRREADTSRIGGGVSEYIEQFVDRIYNDMIQFIYVYYEEAELENVLGEEKAKVYLQSKGLFRGRRLRVSVKEGSLIPKDPLTKRNEAIDLNSQGLLRPKDLFERLDEPDPEGLEQSLLEWEQMKAGQLQPTGAGQQIPGNPNSVPEPTGDPLNQVPI